MYSNIISDKQKKLLPFIKCFTDYYLAGGTSLALQLGHRESIDFDMFKNEELSIRLINSKIREFDLEVQKVIVKNAEEYSLVLGNVKCTFLYFPYNIVAKGTFEGICLPGAVTIGAMKAFAMGRRSKWKDYVDMYFLLHKFSIKEIIDEAVTVFGTFFSDRLFLEQLCFFEDIDYSEEVKYTGKVLSKEEVQSFLRRVVGEY